MDKLTAPFPPADPPLVEPGPAAGWWEETPEQAKRADEDYWADRLYGDEPDDPADHYNY